MLDSWQDCSMVLPPSRKSFGSKFRMLFLLSGMMERITTSPVLSTSQGLTKSTTCMCTQKSLYHFSSFIAHWLYHPCNLLRSGVKNPRHGNFPLGGVPPPPPRTRIFRKVSGKKLTETAFFAEKTPFLGQFLMDFFLTKRGTPGSISKYQRSKYQWS